MNNDNITDFLKTNGVGKPAEWQNLLSPFALKEVSCMYSLFHTVSSQNGLKSPFCQLILLILILMIVYNWL
jgi:hypothetical protein